MLPTAQDNTLPAGVPTGAWGSEGVSSRDILIPRLDLMQDISTLVKGKKAAAGDIVDSNTGEIVASGTKSASLIPIYSYAEWMVNELIQQGAGKVKEKYVRRERIYPGNEAAEPQWLEDGRTYARQRWLCFYVLLADKLDGFPYLMSFKKASLREGKKLATYFQNCQMRGVPPASSVFSLLSEVRTWDTNTFHGPVLNRVRPSSKEELAAAFNWYKAITSGQTAVADEVDHAEEPNFQQ